MRLMWLWSELFLAEGFCSLFAYASVCRGAMHYDTRRAGLVIIADETRLPVLLPGRMLFQRLLTGPVEPKNKEIQTTSAKRRFILPGVSSSAVVAVAVNSLRGDNGKSCSD